MSLDTLVRLTIVGILLLACWLWVGGDVLDGLGWSR